MKVDAYGYFLNIKENRKFNDYINEYPNSNFKDYIMKKYNAKYVGGTGIHDVGYFVFENKHDALIFMLKYSSI